MTKSRDLVIGTAGHIDHGKTSLVRALTGIDTDRLPAEVRRGITIDLGFAALDLDGHRLAIVDVPGHERFIRNMLAGASGLDLAILVVAADDSVMPQTREHLEILSLLGLGAGVIALTKCDLVEPSWLDLVEAEIRTEVAGTFLEDAEIIRTSVVSGAGIEDLRRALGRLRDLAPDRTDLGPFRMAIDRSFSVPGHGTVVTGTVASGVADVGAELELLPEGRLVRVRGIHRHDRRVESVGRGSRAAINLAGVSHDEIRRGQELATPGYLAASRILSAELRASHGLRGRIRHKMRYRVHLGTAEVGASLSLLEADPPSEDRPMLAQLFLDSPVAATHGQPLILRQETPQTTLGGGIVLQAVGRRIRRRDRRSVALLEDLASPDPSVRALAALNFLGVNDWTDLVLSRDAGIAVEEVERVMHDLTTDGKMTDLACGARRVFRVASDVAHGLEERVLRAVGRLHLAHPRHSMVLRSRLNSDFSDIPNDSIVDAIVERLGQSEQLLIEGRRVALADHRPKLTPGERRLKSELRNLFRKSGLAPPAVEEIPKLVGARPESTREMLELLVEEELLVYIGSRVYLDPEVVEGIKETVSERLAGGESITVAELRDLLRTSRKYAVPIVEYLDRIGLTVRRGDLRALTATGKSEEVVEGSFS